MASPSRPRRRLPARVYWVRRAMVLGTALLLVVAVSRMLGGSDEGPSADDKATTASSKATVTPSSAAGPLGPMPLSTGTPAVPTATPTGAAPPVGLPDPDGPCDADEITVTPAAGTPDAGGPVPLLLQLTGTRPACTFAVSPGSVVAKVTTAGGKRIWSSQDCPSAVRASSVVVRSGTPTTVQVTWNGRKSDQHCSRSTAWAVPGPYRVEAAVIGSEPGEATFKLGTPPRPVVTKTITPKPKKKTDKKKQTPSVGRRSQ